MTAAAIEALQHRLGYRFSDLGRLEQALTHASVGTAPNYERLEFLGDRVLGLVMAEIIYQAFPDESEGALAKRHAALVAGETLAVIAREVGIDEAMRMSAPERAAGGAKNDNILADGLEAIFGALYLDSGIMPCRELIWRIWGDRVRSMTEPPQDPKTALQEWAQGRGLPLPLYEVISKDGPDHAPLFEIRVTVQGFAPEAAQGNSRRAAEKEAARKLLSQVQ